MLDGPVELSTALQDPPDGPDQLHVNPPGSGDAVAVKVTDDFDVQVLSTATMGSVVDAGVTWAEMLNWAKRRVLKIVIDSTERQKPKTKDGARR